MPDIGFNPFENIWKILKRKKSNGDLSVVERKYLYVLYLSRFKYGYLRILRKYSNLFNNDKRYRFA